MDTKTKTKTKTNPRPAAACSRCSTGSSPRWAALTATSRTAACPTTCRRWRRRLGRPRRIPRSRVRSRRTAFPPRRSLYAGGASRRGCRTRRRGRNAWRVTRGARRNRCGLFTWRCRCFGARRFSRGSGREPRRETRPRRTRRRRVCWWRRWRRGRSSWRACPWVPFPAPSVPPPAAAAIPTAATSGSRTCAAWSRASARRPSSSNSARSCPTTCTPPSPSSRRTPRAIGDGKFTRRSRSSRRWREPRGFGTCGCPATRVGC
mmetsp:Transcript_2416/g.9802  ORF Transcript_2416/g.9802 Transcript_2416/m.9802 type:complete len:262 (-) Transcript_2416:3364-4149(-)